jgi:hypothetical protein
MGREEKAWEMGLCGYFCTVSLEQVTALCWSWVSPLGIRLNMTMNVKTLESINFFRNIRDLRVIMTELPHPRFWEKRWEKGCMDRISAFCGVLSWKNDVTLSSNKHLVSCARDRSSPPHHHASPSQHRQ